MLGAPGLVTVVNVTLIESNKFYLLPYPDNCFVNNITIQAREKATITIRFNSNEEFITLKPYGVYWEQGIKFHGRIEVSSITAGTIVETVFWMERI